MKSRIILSKLRYQYLFLMKKGLFRILGLILGFSLLINKTIVHAQNSDLLDYDTLSNTYYLKGSKTPANGKFVLKDTYSFGGAAMRGKMKDGKRVGIWKCYYFRIGKRLFSKCRYVNGYANGLEKCYHYRGRLCSIGNYVNGKRDGVWKTYYNNKRLDWEEHFTMGSANGLSRKYHFNGNLHWEGYYSYGSREGIWKEGSSPTNYKEGYYHDNKKNGLCVEYREGILKYEKCYTDNIEDGLCKEYHSNGRLQVEGNYTLGKRVGWWKSYYNINHQLISEGRFINNLKEGLWFYYCPDGTLYETHTFRDGKQVE